MENSRDIVLTSWEIFWVAQAGIMRQVENIKLKRKHAYGADDSNNWQCNIEGCMGEYVIAKYLGLHWSGKGVFRGPDVGDVDVRTGSKAGYGLIVHPNDPDDRKFWLVTGCNGQYSVRGWIMAKDGKKPEYWRDPSGDKTGNKRPAFFVPQRALNQRDEQSG